MAEWRRCSPWSGTRSCAGPDRGYQSCLVLRPPDLGLAAAPQGQRAPIPVARDPSYTPVSAIWPPRPFGTSEPAPQIEPRRPRSAERRLRSGSERGVVAPSAPASLIIRPLVEAGLRGVPFAQADPIRPTTALIRSSTSQTTGLVRPGVDRGGRAWAGPWIEAVGPVAISGPT
jgi:hypothetical protein